MDKRETGLEFANWINELQNRAQMRNLWPGWRT